MRQGIVFTLIIIRVGLGETASEHSKGLAGESRVTNPPPSLPVNGQQFPLRPLAINVSVSRTHDRASLEEYDKKEIVAARGFDIESGHDSTP